MTTPSKAATEAAEPTTMIMTKPTLRVVQQYKMVKVPAAGLRGLFFDVDQEQPSSYEMQQRIDGVWTPIDIVHVRAKKANPMTDPENAAKPDTVEAVRNAIGNAIFDTVESDVRACALTTSELAIIAQAAIAAMQPVVTDAPEAYLHTLHMEGSQTILSTRSEPPSLFDVWLTLKAWWQGVGVPLRLYLETMTPLIIMAMQVRTEDAATRATKDAIRKDRLVPQR